MADYSKTVNFAAKDALISGNPNKAVQGTELNTEFDNIATASNTKADKASPTFTGTVNTAATVSTVDDAINSATTSPQQLIHTTSGTPANGIGVSTDYVVETTAGNNETGMVLGTVVTDVTSTSEDFDFVVDLMAAGAPAAEKFRVSSTGVATATTFNGDLIGNVIGDVLGNIQGNVTGNVTGNVSGDVIGDVLGNLEGFVNTPTQTAITSLGTLTSLDVAGTLDSGAATITGNSSITGTLDVSGNTIIGSTSVTPDGTLHVYSGSAGAVTANANANDLVVENNGDAGISILSTDAEQSRVIFGSPSDDFAAALIWDYTASEFKSGSSAVGASHVLAGDNLVTNLTLSGASGSELATFAGGATFAGDVRVGAVSTTITGLTKRNLVVGSSTGGEIVAYRAENASVAGDFVGAFLFGNDDNSGTEDHFAGMWGKISNSTGSADLHWAAGAANYENDTPQMTLTAAGDLLVEGLTVDDGGIIQLTKNTVSAGDSLGIIEFHDEDGSATADAGKFHLQAFRGDDKDAPDFKLIGSDSTGVLRDRILVANNGDISFYDDGGVDQKLFWDASAASLGIGTTTPDGTLHVHTASAGAVFAGTKADDLVVENSAEGGISILTPDASLANIFFGSPTDNKGAVISWSYDSDTFTLASGKTGASLSLGGDNLVPNLTLSGASGSELATFAGKVDIGGSGAISTEILHIGDAASSHFTVSQSLASGYMRSYSHNTTGYTGSIGHDTAGVFGIGTGINTSNNVVSFVGDDATFAGDVTLSADKLLTISATSGDSTSGLWLYDGGGSALKLYQHSSDAYTIGVGSNTNIQLDNSGKATFAGDVTYSGDLVSTTLGTNNFVAGSTAGDSIIAGGTYNTLVGDNAGTATTTGDYNTALGWSALAGNTTGISNIAIGGFALDANTISNYSTAVGYQALGASTGAKNTALGRDAGLDVTTGSNLTLIGHNAQPSSATAINEMTFGDTNVTLNRFNGSLEASGVYLGGTGAANLLDDYEEGTWTPIAADATSGGNTGTTGNGTYTKTGNTVRVTAALSNVDTTGMTAGNNFSVQGFPFGTGDIFGVTGHFTSCAVHTSAVTTSSAVWSLLEDNGLTATQFYDTGGAILVSDITSGSGDFYFTVVYQTA